MSCIVFGDLKRAIWSNPFRIIRIDLPMNVQNNRVPFYIFILIATLVSCTASKEPLPKRPNIIVIFSDELQFEDIGYFGGKFPTPRIDALARQSVVFDHTYTPSSMCTPSRYAFLTGQYPGRCKHSGFLKANPYTEPYSIAWNTYLDSTTMTFPKLLSSNGYVTGMSGKWHLGPEDVLPGFLLPGDDPSHSATQTKLKKHQEFVSKEVKRSGGFEQANSVMFGNFDRFMVKDLQFHNFPWITRGAVNFIEEHAHQEKPFFLYLAPTSIHGPHHTKGLAKDFALTPEGYLPDVRNYSPDVSEIQAQLKGLSSPKSHRLAGMVLLDHQVGLIMDTLVELGIDKETIVIFMPDHNTEPAKATCYEKGLRIPMIFHAGNRYPKRVISTKIRSLDLFPTILEIAGVPLPKEHPLDGQSILPLLKDNNRLGQSNSPIFAEAGYTRSINDGRFKYIAFRYPKHIEKKIVANEIDYAPNYLDQVREGLAIVSEKSYPSYYEQDQLFDLNKDPYEQNNLAHDPKYSQILIKLKRDLSQHLKTFEHPFSLEISAVMESGTYKERVEETKKMQVADQVWFKRDWGKIVWPPKEKIEK